MSYTFEQLEKAIKENHSTRQDFIKHLLTIASGMLAILAALHTAETARYIHILYLSTLTLLSIGITTGGVSLYYDTAAAKFMYLKIKEAMIKKLKDPSTSTRPIVYNPPKLFFICEKACYITLLLSVILLASYAALK